ncbi:MAG: hypothetical protein AAFN30_10385, partial [Actinomycetota bacterium]
MSDHGLNEFTNFSFDNFGSDSDLDAELNAANESSLFAGVSLAVVDADQAVRDYLSGLFGGRIDKAGTMVEIETRLGSSPIVVVLGPSCSGPEELAIVQQWSRMHPHVGVVLVTAEISTELLQKALRSGVRDVLSAPIEQEQLVETVTRIAEGLRSSSPQPAGPSDDMPMPEEAGELGRVLTVFSTKGGSGKSVTATNIGVVLAQRSDRPVVLIDGHLQFGDAAVMLKLQPDHTVVDAVAQLDAPDAPQLLRQMMTLHEPSGLLVLPAPVEPTFADQVSGQHMASLVEIIRGFAGHVIIDLPAIFNEVVLSIVECSDEIILVAGLDIPNIKNVKIGLSTLSLLSVPTEKLHLVLNRADSK